MPDVAAEGGHAVFQLISSERKNDAVIATAICSGHKSRARLLRHRVDIDIHRAAQNGVLPRVFVFLLFFLFFSRLAARPELEPGSNYCYYFVVNEVGAIFIGRARIGRYYMLSALVSSPGGEIG